MKDTLSIGSRICERGKRTRRACADGGGGGRIPHCASLASDLPLNAASTSLNSHAVVGRFRRLINRAITPASTLPRANGTLWSHVDCYVAPLRKWQRCELQVEKTKSLSGGVALVYISRKLSMSSEFPSDKKSCAIWDTVVW